MQNKIQCPACATERLPDPWYACSTCGAMLLGNGFIPVTIRRVTTEGDMRQALIEIFYNAHSQIIRQAVALGEDHKKADARAIAIDLIRSGRVIHLFLEVVPMVLQDPNTSADSWDEAVTIQTAYDGCRGSRLVASPNGRRVQHTLTQSEQRSTGGHRKWKAPDISILDVVEAACERGVYIHFCDITPFDTSRGRPRQIPLHTPEALNLRDVAMADAYRRVVGTGGGSGCLLLNGLEHFATDRGTGNALDSLCRIRRTNVFDCVDPLDQSEDTVEDSVE